jgi:hypothetical protein
MDVVWRRSVEKFRDYRLVKCRYCEKPAVAMIHSTGLPFGTWNWTIAVENVCTYHYEMHMGRPA